MSPFLANLMVGGILALIAWCITFAIWVVKENGARKDENQATRLEIEKIKSEFVSQTAWNQFNQNFDQWKGQVLDKIGHLAEQIAALTGKPTR